MVKLKALQQRATQYVLYYTKFSKARLKFCLIEDAIQYNIQLTLFIMTGTSFANFKFGFFPKYFLYSAFPKVVAFFF